MPELEYYFSDMLPCISSEILVFLLDLVTPFYLLRSFNLNCISVEVVILEPKYSLYSVLEYQEFYPTFCKYVVEF